VGSALSPWQDKLSAHPASSRDLWCCQWSSQVLSFWAKTQCHRCWGWHSHLSSSFCGLVIKCLPKTLGLGNDLVDRTRLGGQRTSLCQTLSCDVHKKDFTNSCTSGFVIRDAWM
jgi:hypothetical protein